jgi:hypothetical protein
MRLELGRCTFYVLHRVFTICTTIFRFFFYTLDIGNWLTSLFAKLEYLVVALQNCACKKYEEVTGRGGKERTPPLLSTPLPAMPPFPTDKYGSLS